MQSTSEIQPAPVAHIPSLFTVSFQVPIELHSTRLVTLETIGSKMLTSSGTTQFYLTGSSSKAVSLPVDAATILETLAFRAPGSFIRSIKEITFGAYAGSNPFIIIKSTDFNTAFAGMLAWETVMSSDLSPLFGTPVTESFDKTARTNTQLRAAFFHDTVVSNVSVRLLVDRNNNERLMYGFVKPNIILITPNGTTFEAIAPLVSTNL